MSEVANYTKSKWSRMQWDATTVRLLGLAINTSASIIMTLHVLLLHEKLQVNKDGEAIIVFNDREGAEQVMMYVSVGLYFLSFFLFLWSAFMEQANHRKEKYLMEKYFGVDFSDLHGVSIDDVEDFDEEKRRGFTVRKAKDVKRENQYEVHTKHENNEF